MRKWLAFIVLISLMGCANKFSQATVDGLGYLPTDDDADIQVTVNQGVDTNQMRKVLYVQTEMHGVVNWNTYEDAVMNGLRELNFFDEVVTRKPTIYINTSPNENTPIALKDKHWFDVNQPAPYQALSKQYGDHFLIAQVTLRNQSAEVDDLNAFFFELKLIESKTSRVVLQISKRGSTTLGIDRALINPVLNYTRGYLLHFDSTYVPDHPPMQSLSDKFESMTYQPAVIWE